MGLSKIKKEHLTTSIAYGKSGLPLGMRSDHDELAIIAQEGNDRYLKSLFEVLPSVADLKKAKTNDELKKIGVVTDTEKKK